jgi:lipoxygenase
LKLGLQEHLFNKIPLVQKIQESSEGMLRYDTPRILSKDKFAWLRDDEFARQMVAGINPVNIDRVKVNLLIDGGNFANVAICLFSAD